MIASLPSVSAAITGVTLRDCVQMSKRSLASPVFGRINGTEETMSCGLPLTFSYGPPVLAAKTSGVLRTGMQSIPLSPVSGIAATATSASPFFTAGTAPAGSPVCTFK